ncbi:multiple C2 and transmembrane domain-containing protein 1 isoform X1 [Tachysurus ichikawai]
MTLKKNRMVSCRLECQSLRLSDVHRKAQLWRGIVSISLIEGRNLQPMDTNGLSDPYIKFRMGHQKYKSKTIHKSLNPQWREQFDFHLYEEEGGFIDITVWDRDAGKKDDFMGRCQVDLSVLSKECTHKLDLPLEEGEGMLVLLVTLTASAAVSISDLSVNMLDDPHERREILHRYSLLRSFNNIKDVGVVQVKVIRAEGLMAADVTGKSDPFCVVELSNDRLQTHTVYKNLNPEWNKVFTFNVKDIHSVLEVTVYDEDRDRSADFLGKVAIPLLSIQNGERKAYALKSKELTGPTKGVIFLEIDVIYNAVKAGLRTLIPIEQKYIEEEPRVSKQLLLQNFNRVRRCIMFLINTGCYINSCFEWESPQRSICAFLLYIVVVWNFELYMIPLALLLLLAWNYVLIASGKDNRQGDVSTHLYNVPFCVSGNCKLIWIKSQGFKTREPVISVPSLTSPPPPASSSVCLELWKVLVGLHNDHLGSVKRWTAQLELRGAGPVAGPERPTLLNPLARKTLYQMFQRQSAGRPEASVSPLRLDLREKPVIDSSPCPTSRLMSLWNKLPSSHVASQRAAQ